MIETSSSIWWDFPSSPTVRPACVAQIFTFRSGTQTLWRICSNALPVANIANELANATFPWEASPAAIPIMFASATPMLKKRSGWAFPKAVVLVDPDRSASRTTTSGWDCPSSRRASPDAFRVATFWGEALARSGAWSGGAIMCGARATARRSRGPEGRPAPGNRAPRGGRTGCTRAPDAASRAPAGIRPPRASGPFARAGLRRAVPQDRQNFGRGGRRSGADVPDGGHRSAWRPAIPLLAYPGTLSCAGPPVARGVLLRAWTHRSTP